MYSRQNWSISLAKTIMKRYPDPKDYYPYKFWCYPQGFMLWGMIRLHEFTGNKDYYDYAMLYADENVDANGNISRFVGNSLDDIMSGSIIVWAYEQTHMDKYKKACDKIRSIFESYPRLSDGGFWHGDWTPHEMWVDGLFMGQMFLAKYGKYVEDSEYCFDEAAKQLMLVYDHCNKGNTGLLYHAWSEDRKPAWADPVTGCSPEVWSEGLGWYAMILVEVLEILPSDHPKRERLVMQLQNLLNGLKNTQDAKSGLWYQVVDKGDISDNWCDTSGSAMFTYAVKKAVELGLADAETYLPVAEKGYRGIITKAMINEAGLVEIIDACDGVCVQKSYEDYINFPRVSNAKEAVAAFLWATIIMEKPGDVKPS